MYVFSSSVSEVLDAIDKIDEDMDNTSGSAPVQRELVSSVQVGADKENKLRRQWRRETFPKTTQS